MSFKAAVLVFPGSNCDRDAAVALERASGRRPVMVWHRETALPALDLIVLPGGFAYGDYLRAGAIAARSPVMRPVREAAARGVAILGICNGFQILIEHGLLPGALLPNVGRTFVSRTVALRVETADSAFTAGYAAGQVIRLPIAHHDGAYHLAPDERAALADDDRIAFRYADANPNGSVDNIAGVLDRGRRVLGLMPHPERAADPLLGGTDGAALFASLAERLAA